ncbi:MAG: hypothetical protein CL424_07045 [Acidimicrobiaceae bacterium]|nr:hypothetical protein [Acidimicrobiaceae bacterium]
MLDVAEGVDGHHYGVVDGRPARSFREAVGWELAFDDLVIVVTENGRAGVRPSRRPHDGCVGRFEESVAATVLFVLVQVPGVFEVGVDDSW